MTDDARKEESHTHDAPAVTPQAGNASGQPLVVPAVAVPASSAPPPPPAPPAAAPFNPAPAKTGVDIPPSPSSPPVPTGTSELKGLRSTSQLPDLTNNKCPTCGLVNRVGVLVCENCGTSLIAGASSVPSTRSLQESSMGTGRLPQDADAAQKILDGEKLPLTTLRLEPKPPTEMRQSSIFTEDTILRLEIMGSPQPVLVYPKKEVMVGRRDATTGTQPDLDLTPYAGYRMGVSRRHLMFRMADRRIEVVDLGSSNGSRLNGIIMQAHQPYLLRDGDLLTLGKMDVRVTFQAPPPPITRLRTES